MIFIIGSAKSGTTWLRSCFSHVTPVPNFNEWCFTEFAEAIRKHVATYGFVLSAEVQDRVATRAIRDGWQGLIDAATPGAVTDKSAYPTGLRRTSPEKRILHAGAVSVAKKYFPEAKTILMVRDPRAVYNSLQHFRSHRKAEQHGVLSTVGHKIGARLKSVNPTDFAQSWNDQNRSWLADRPTAVCRYEDLKSNFSETLQHVLEACEFTMSDQELLEIQNAEYDIRKVERRQEKLFRSNDVTVGEPKVSKQYRKGEIDDWKKHLTQKELKVITSRANAVMTELGYI